MSQPIPIRSTATTSSTKSHTIAASPGTMLNQILQTGSPTDIHTTTSVQHQPSSHTTSTTTTHPSRMSNIISHLTHPFTQQTSLDDELNNHVTHVAPPPTLTTNTTSTPPTQVPHSTISNDPVPTASLAITNEPSKPHVMPAHPPPPPPPTNQPTSQVSPTVSLNNTPRGSITGSNTNPTTTSAPLSPKTSKLLRRIKKREDELEELTLENELLKEANRRGNEERSVREQERRVEARRRAEIDAVKDQEIESLKEKIRQLTHGLEEHNPQECARTISELTELLQLREEQLELINLDRSKLYEEIETWKIGMEKLASLQAYGAVTPPHAPLNSSSHQLAPPTIVAAASQLVDSHKFARASSEFKADSNETEHQTLNHSPLPPDGNMQMTPVPTPDAALSPNSSSAATATSFEPVIEEIWENQHRHPFFGFQPTSYPFLRHPFSDETGSIAKNFEDMKLPKGWVWDQQWHLDHEAMVDENAGEEGFTAQTVVAAQDKPTTSSLDAKFARLRASIGLGSKNKPTPDSVRVGTDANGWRYSIQYKLFAWHSEPGRLDTVRRRRWLRRRCWVGEAATEAMLQNALAAIAAVGGIPSLAIADGETTTDSNATATSKPSLGELAAAYSSGSAGDSFSMFTSVTPPGVGSSTQESSSARALAALLHLGGYTVPESTPTDATAKSTKPLDDALIAASASTSESSSSSASTTSAAPASATGVIANLSSYLASSRVASWVTRKSHGSTAEPSVTTTHIAAPSHPDDLSPSSTPTPFAPSPICSFCETRARTAMQYVHPLTSMMMPIASFCLPHYHACQKHIVLEFQLANPDPLSEEEIKEREGKKLQPNLCGYCNSLDTYPVQILHLAVPPTNSTDSTASTTPTTDPVATEVLDAHTVYRFCERHMTPFLKLIQQFQPSTASISPKSDAIPEEEVEEQKEAATNGSNQDESSQTTSTLGTEATSTTTDAPTSPYSNPFSAHASAPRLASPPPPPAAVIKLLEQIEDGDIEL